MPKKAAANINTIGSSCYAILVPGVGYLKNVWGQIEFEEKLPKASGCYLTEQEARQGLIKATETARESLIKTTEEYGPRPNAHGQWFIDRSTATLNNIQSAVVVKLSVEIA